MIVGIGGVSRAGKTTLANLMAKLFLARGKSVGIIHQDKYVHEESALPRIRDSVNWEHPSSIRIEDFREAIVDAEKENDLVIAEGLLCFYNPEITDLMDRKILVTISKDTFLERKKEDLRWGSEPDPDWYMEHIWHSYLKYGKPQTAEYFTINGNQYFDLITVVQYILHSGESN
ncbi:MAG: nicotinamide/nicotinate riboside kinase [Saprospiraceae bacterium]|jgi:nicotinamide/nicotinate riboside kinase